MKRDKLNVLAEVLGISELEAYDLIQKKKYYIWNDDDPAPVIKQVGIIKRHGYYIVKNEGEK